MLPRLAVRVVIGCQAFVLLACASVPREPWVLDSSAIRVDLTRRADQIDSYPRALGATVEVLRRDLGLPALQVRLVFLPDRAAFETLLLEIGYTPTLARDASEQMVAVGGHRHVLINEERLSARSWPERIGLLAHELGHVLQYELGGGVRGQSDQWLREGHADWLELRVLAALGLADEDGAHRRSLRRLRGHLRSGELPRLDQLTTFPAWVQAGRNGRGGALYNKALVATRFLIDRHGHEGVLRYFRRFSRVQDRTANFREAFGEDIPAFEAAFERYVLAR